MFIRMVIPNYVIFRWYSPREGEVVPHRGIARVYWKLAAHRGCCVFALVVDVFKVGLQVESWPPSGCCSCDGAKLDSDDVTGADLGTAF